MGGSVYAILACIGSEAIELKQQYPVNECYTNVEYYVKRDLGDPRKGESFMSGVLRVAGAIIAVAGGLIGLAVSLAVVYSELGGVVGLLVGLLLFPVTFSLVPFYTLLTDGSWNLLLINYGTILGAWVLDWIADELERREDAPGTEPAATEDRTSAAAIWLVVGTIFLVLLILAFARPGAASISSYWQAATHTPLPESTATEKPVSMKACVTETAINIRSGPGTQYQVIDGLRAATCMSILGRNPDSSWVYILSEEDQVGWVAASLVSIEGDVTRVAIRPEEGARGSAPTTIPSRLVPLCFELAHRLGEYVSCKIERASCMYHPDLEGSPTICSDRSYPSQGFQFVVAADNWSNYDDSCIVISGYLETHREGLQIQGFNRSQVSYCE